MRTPSLTATLLFVVPLAAGCGQVVAQTEDTAAPLTVMGVVGNCPADAGPMRPTIDGNTGDLNGDGYVCPKLIRSINGDTLRGVVDNDAETPYGVWTLPEPYIGM